MSAFINNEEPTKNIDESYYPKAIDTTYDVLKDVVQKGAKYIDDNPDFNKDLFKTSGSLAGLSTLPYIGGLAGVGAVGAGLAGVGATAYELGRDYLKGDKESAKKKVEELYDLKDHPTFEKLVTPKLPSGFKDLNVSNYKTLFKDHLDAFPNIDTGMTVKSQATKEHNPKQVLGDKSTPYRLDAYGNSVPKSEKRKAKSKKLLKNYNPGSANSNDEITKILNQISSLESQKKNKKDAKNYENVINSPSNLH